MINSTRFAAVYIRVSTEDQAELSPDSQLEKIQEYARRENLVILQEYVYMDVGISGKKADRRPEFMRMIAEAKGSDCPFSVLLVWKFSRFARNQEESIFYKSILRSKCGVDVVSISEPLIAGHFGSLIERIIEWMDEFYSVRLSEEVKRSMEVNARRGKLQSTPSFGYRAEGGKLVPEPKEAAIVRQVFQWFIDGKGLYRIARDLNAMGVKTHRGNEFENRTIEYMIRNPVYIGKIRWNPTGRTSRDFFNENIITADGEHEPLITEDLWEQAQKRMDAVKVQWGYKARPTTELKHWLSGIVRCSACGATLVFSLPHYYKCGNYAKGRCRHSQHITAAQLADTLLATMERDAENLSLSEWSIGRGETTGGADLSRLEATLRQLKTKRSRLQDAYLSGVIELEDFASAKKSLESSIRSIMEEMELMQNQTSPEANQEAMRSGLKAAIKTIKDPNATTEEKNNAARSVIEKCIFDKENATITITYRILV